MKTATNMSNATKSPGKSDLFLCYSVTSYSQDELKIWKAFDREEWRISRQVRLFNFLVYTPSKAFILYLCWNLANLRGNSVRLLKLEEKQAIVKMQLLYFRLFRNAAHLKEQISFEDYQKLFESIWRDRAEKAGWSLDITYSDKECLECTFRFTRKESQS